MCKKLLFLLCALIGNYSVVQSMEDVVRSHYKAQLAQLVKAFERAEDPEAKEQAEKDMLACYENDLGESFLHCAVCLGHLSLAKALYEQQPLDKRQAFLNKQTQSGSTALHYAVAVCCPDGYVCGHVQMVQWLLEQGACVATKNDIGRTPLHCAVKWPNENAVEIIALLLDNNPSILNETNMVEQTALDWVVYSHKHYESAEALVLRGGTLNAELTVGIVTQDKRRLLELLFAHGLADPYKILEYKNALSDAMAHKAYNVARLLLSYGADILRDDNQKNAFHLARDTEAVQLLITAPQIAQRNAFWQKECKRIVSLWLCLQYRSVPKDIRRLLCSWLVYADLDELVGCHLDYVSKALQQEAVIEYGRGAEHGYLKLLKMIPWEYARKRGDPYSQEAIEMLRMTDDQLKGRCEGQIRKGYVPLLHNKLRLDVGDQHEK